MSDVAPDLRAPCGYTSEIQEEQVIWLGACNASNQSGSTSTVYTNFTKVAPLTSGGSNIDPYPRPLPDGQPDCGNYDDYTCGDGSNGNFFCGVPTSSDVNVAPTGSIIYSGPYSNSFIPSSASVLDYPTCSALTGFKNVYAKKAWVGTYGYLADNFLPQSQTDFCCACAYYPYNLSADTVKYLSIDAEASISGDVDFGGGDTETYNGSASSTSTIDKFGNQTSQTCFSSSYDSETTSSNWGGEMYEQLGLAQPGTTVYVTYCNDYNNNYAEWGDPYYTSGGGNSWTVWFGSSSYGPATIMNVTLPTSYNISNYGFYNPMGGGSGYYTQLTYDELDISDGAISSTGWSIAGSCVFDASSNYSITGNLSNTYTSGQVSADVENLLSSSYWDLGNDAIYNWRTDGDYTTGPLMCYDENPGATPNVPSCPNTSSAVYTGNVKGAPMPAGYNAYWDAAHINYAICTDTDTGCTTRYINTVGDWSTNCHVPAATSWTNLNEVVNLPPGPFMGANFFYTLIGTCTEVAPQLVIDDQMYGCKWAELIISKPSFNYARPCGIDRISPSQSQAWCVSGSVSQSIILSPTGPVFSAASGSNVFVYGVGAQDGVWTVSGGSGSLTVSLGTQLASASQFPAIPFEAGTGILVGLRWFDSPGICGRVTITNATTTNPVTCSLDTPSYLAVNDTVSITGNTSSYLYGNWQIQSVIDSSTVVLSGSNGVSQSFADVMQMYSYGAPDWKWNDVSSKNDFTVNNWTTNYRTVGEYVRMLGVNGGFYALPNCTTGTCSNAPVPSTPNLSQANCGLDNNVTNVSCNQSCLKYVPCAPSVVYFSPSSEPMLSSSYSTYYGGWTTTYVDNRYPSMWNAWVKQADTDYFYVAPPCPCQQQTDGDGDTTGYGCAGQWIEDNGGCEEDSDDVSYYPSAILNESRCSPPTGSPATAAPYMGCANTSAFTSGSCPQNVCPLPINNGWGNLNALASGPNYTPFYVVWNAEYSCVCGDGRWASLYSQQQGITCNVEFGI